MTEKEKYEKRYHKASQVYLTKNNPEKIADMIIDNSDFDNLKLIKNSLTKAEAIGVIERK